MGSGNLVSNLLKNYYYYYYLNCVFRLREVE